MCDGGRGAETGRENPKQSLHCQHRAQCEAQSHKLRDHALSRNQQLDAQLTEPPRCPWVASNFFFFHILNDYVLRAFGAKSLPMFIVISLC